MGYIKWTAWLFVVIGVELVASECPWSSNRTDLNNACKCTIEDGNLPVIKCNNVDFGRLLETLQESTNSTTKIVNQLHVRNTTIGILPDRIFNGTKIKQLRLTQCQIRIIADDAFTGLRPYLIGLDLQDNLLTEVPIKSLERLEISSLDLSRNKIKTLRDDTFENTVLEEIHLADNEMKVSEKAFQGLEDRLKMLNLKGTGLTTVPETVLKITSLQHLDLAQNKIGNLKDRQFSSLTNLQWLNLERNRIIKLEANTFQGLGNNLRTLSLLNNILLSFPKVALAKLTSLKVLDIGFNGIRVLPEDAFETMPDLTLLAIEGNPLRTIPKASFEHLNGTLKGFSFGGRYLNCDCRIKWISEWVRDDNMQVSSRERNPQFCGFPEEFQTRGFYQINVNEFKCDETTTSPTTTTTSTTTTTTTTTVATTTPTKKPIEIRATEKTTVIPTPETIRQKAGPTRLPRPVNNFGNVGPPLIPPPPPPILKVVKRPPRPRLLPKNNDINNLLGPSNIQEIKVTKAQRKGANIIIEWDALTANFQGYNVIYRTFGESTFHKSEVLPSTERYYMIKSLPKEECCFVVCVVRTEDTVRNKEDVSNEQCTEVKTEEEEPEESTIDMDNIIIGVSAAICAVVIIAVIVFLVCNCCCGKKHNKKNNVAAPQMLPPMEQMKMEPDWDRASLYSARSIPRARLYHDTKSNGSTNNGYLTEDSRSYSLSHIPNGYHDSYSRSMMPEVHSHRSPSRNSYVPQHHHQSQQSLGRQSAYSMSQMSAHHSHMGMTPPVEQRRKRLDRVGRVGGISAASSLHSLTSYGQEPAIRQDNWQDHDIDIYVGRNHVARPNGKGHY